MKRIALLPLLMLLVGSLLAQCPKEKAGTPFPEISVTGVTGQKLTTSMLPVGQPIVIIYFDPFCDHCEQQAKWIKEKIDAFRGVTIVWITWGELEDMKNFAAKNFAGVTKSDMVFTKDTDYAMDSWFGYSEVPSIYIYNKERVRTMCFSKETPVEELVKWFK